MLIQDYLTNKISLLAFINYLDNNDVDEKVMIEAINNHLEDDRTYIAYICLFFLKKMTFDNYDIPFISFLRSIEIETENDFNTKIIWHLQNEEVVFFQIDHVYFAINNYNKKYAIELPEELQNTNKLCINCNDEIFLKKELILQATEFYLISNIVE